MRWRARRVLLATGMDYTYRPIPGLEERWGGSVFHCPFCHGWEHRGQPLGLLGRGPSAAHMGVLLQARSDDVTLLSDGPAELDAKLRAQLAAAGTTIDERPVASLAIASGSNAGAGVVQSLMSARAAAGVAA